MHNQINQSLWFLLICFPFKLFCHLSFTYNIISFDFYLLYTILFICFKRIGLCVRSYLQTYFEGFFSQFKKFLLIVMKFKISFIQVWYIMDSSYIFLQLLYHFITVSNYLEILINIIYTWVSNFELIVEL